MKRIPVFLLLIVFLFGFNGCGEDDGPSGPTMSAPGNFTAASISDQAIQLTWTDETDFETGFKVQRNTVGANNWVEIADLPEDVEAYVDDGLGEGESYQYRVNAYTVNAASHFTEPAVASTWPRAPMTLAASRLSETSLHIEWIDSSAIEEGFEIQRKLSNVQDFDSITVVAANTISYDDLDLQSARTYVYRVRALKGGQPSAWSNTARATTTVYTPAAPVNLRAEALPGNTAMLTWEDRAYNELGFVVQSSLTMDAGWATIDSIQLVNQRTYNAEDLVSSTTYYFRVYTYNEFGDSPYSNVVELLTPAGPPLAPSDLTAAAPTWRAVELAWIDNSNDETGFVLQRREDLQTMWDHVDSIATDEITYTNEGVVARKTYSYRIKAFSDAGSSSWSNIATVTVPPGPPLTPSGLVVRTQSSTSIRVDWVDVRNENMYIIERSMEGEPAFQPVQAYGADTTYFVDTGLIPETWYAYRVQAVNDQGMSAFCDPDSSQTYSLTVFVDTFEEYGSGIPPDNPAYDFTINGASWIRVDETNPHEGNKCLHFYDAIDDGNSMAQAILTHRPITKGIASCWIYLDANGYFGVIGGEPRNYLTFRIQFNGDNTFYVQDNGALVVGGASFPVYEWFRLQFTFDVSTQLYDIQFSDELVGDDLQLQRPDHPSENTLVFTCFSDATINNVYIDELVILETLDEAEGLHSPNSPSGILGTDKFTNSRKVGPVR